MFTIRYRCPSCRDFKDHPSVLRSIPRCEKCEMTMVKLVCPHCGANEEHDGYCGVC